MNAKRSNKLVIFDLDKTICDCRWRDKVATYAGYAQYHNLCSYDALWTNIAETVNNYYNSLWTVIMITGRNVSQLNKTEKWLAKHNVPYHFIFMRPKGNKMSSATLKRTIYNDILSRKEEFNLADEIIDPHIYDDKESVLDAFKGIGFRCFMVETGKVIYHGGLVK